MMFRIAQVANGFDMPFNSVEDLQKYVDEEKTWFRQRGAGHQNDTWYAWAQERYRDIDSAISGLVRASGDQKENRKADVQRALDQAYTSEPRLVPYKSDIAKALSDAKNVNGTNMIGVVLPHLMKHKIGEERIPVSDALGLCFAMLHSSKIVHDAIAAASQQSAKVVAELKDWKDDVVKQMEAVREQDAVDRKDALARFENIKSIDQPAAYWSSRARWNIAWTWLCIIAAALIAGFGGRGLYHLSVSASKDVDAVLSTSVANESEVTFWHVMPHWWPVVAIAVLLWWTLRIIVRFIFSFAHLAADARERVTLADTYLALREAKVSLDKEDLKIILAQLFRHAATGIVKEDAAPQLPLPLAGPK